MPSKNEWYKPGPFVVHSVIAGTAIAATVESIDDLVAKKTAILEILHRKAKYDYNLGVYQTALNKGITGQSDRCVTAIDQQGILLSNSRDTSQINVNRSQPRAPKMIQSTELFD